MKFIFVAIYDRAVGGYQRPFVAPSKGAAIRAFGDEATRDGSEIKKHPGDYELHELGLFDDSNGLIVAHEDGKPARIAGGKDYVPE